MLAVVRSRLASICAPLRLSWAAGSKPAAYSALVLVLPLSLGIGTGPLLVHALRAAALAVSPVSQPYGELSPPVLAWM